MLDAAYLEPTVLDLMAATENIEEMVVSHSFEGDMVRRFHSDQGDEMEFSFDALVDDAPIATINVWCASTSAGVELGFDVKDAVSGDTATIAFRSVEELEVAATQSLAELRSRDHGFYYMVYAEDIEEAMNKSPQVAYATISLATLFDKWYKQNFITQTAQ